MGSDRFTSWIGNHLVGWNVALAVGFLLLAAPQFFDLASGEGRSETKLFIAITMLIACASSTTVAFSVHAQKRRRGVQPDKERRRVL